MSTNNKSTNPATFKNSKELSQLLEVPPKHLFSNFGSFTYSAASKRKAQKNKEQHSLTAEACH